MKLLKVQAKMNSAVERLNQQQLHFKTKKKEQNKI
jgi:hypothetical protein